MKSQVTLCHENELEELGNVLHDLVNLTFSCFTINFGNVVRFFQDKGQLIPEVGENLAFYNLKNLFCTVILKRMKNLHPILR